MPEMNDSRMHLTQLLLVDDAPMSGLLDCRTWHAVGISDLASSEALSYSTLCSPHLLLDQLPALFELGVAHGHPQNSIVGLCFVCFAAQAALLVKSQGHEAPTIKFWT